MDKRIFSCIVFIAILLLIFSGTVFGQTQGGAPPAGEAPGGAPPAGGGPAWMNATGDEMPKAFIKAEDGNGDGKVSKDEFGGPDTLFDQWDKNKDGSIELSEAPTPDMMQGMGGQGGAPGGAPVGAPGGAEGGTPPEGGMPSGGFVANSPHVGDGPTGQAFIDAMDTNKDGKIDHDEWEANKIKTVYKNKRWPEYNKNMDQYITLDEAPQKGVNWEAVPTEVKSSTPNTNQIAFIAKFDKNQDGKVDNTEFTGQHFPVYDANSDGFIEPLEAPAGQTAY